MISMMRGYVLTIGIALLHMVQAAEVQSSDLFSGREARYQISSHGFNVGEMKSISQPLLLDGKRFIRFSSSTAIDAKFLFFSVNSSSLNETLVGHNGPIEFHHSNFEKGDNLEVDAKFFDDQVELSIKQHGKSRSVSFARDHYEFTTMDCAEMTLSKEGELKNIRLLDLENFRLVTRTYVWRKSEDIVVGGKTIRCRVIDFEDPYNHCRRWITQDENGFLIVRQEGKGKAGSYVLKLTELLEK